MELDASWSFWVADNLDRGTEPALLVETLVRHGFAPPSAEAVVEAAADPTVRAAMASRSQRNQLQKRDWILETYQRLSELSSLQRQVERCGPLSRSEFLERFYAVNRPVLMEGVLTEWKALALWSPQYLRQRLGRRPVEIQSGRDSDCNYEVNADRLRQTVPFDRFIDLITRGPSNDVYMTANNSKVNMRALRPLIADYSPPLTEYLDPRHEQAQGFFWFGPRGLMTPLHHDLTNNFMAQVRGRKRVRLIAPYYQSRVYNYRHVYSELDLDAVDLVRYPLFRDVPVLEVMLQPGDLLFLPVGWWHDVKALDISVTISFTNFVYGNHFNDNFHTLGPL